MRGIQMNLFTPHRSWKYSGRILRNSNLLLLVLSTDFEESESESEEESPAPAVEVPVIPKV